MTVDIIDYIGKYEDGVLVLLSLGYENQFYETIFYYQSQLVGLTPDPNLEKKIGSKIEEWSGYTDLVFDILKKVVPYDEIVNRLDEFQPSDYDLYLDTGTQSNPNTDIQSNT